MTTEEKTGRTERQENIVQAARRCFRQKGLYAASMADIAREAQLGPGQIYRCFENKEAIVEAIVQDIISQRLQHMLATNHNLVQKADELAQGLAGIDGFDAQDNALLLEINAEAARNPRIAEILIRADQTLFREGCRLIRQHYPELDDTQTHMLSEIMAVLTEGTLARRHIRGARNIDTQSLLQGYLTMLHALFAETPRTPSEQE